MLGFFLELHERGLDSPVSFVDTPWAAQMRTLRREYDVIEHPDGSFAITCTSTIKFVLIDGFPDRARAEAYIGKIQVEDSNRDPPAEG